MKPVTFAIGMLPLGSTITLADTCLLFVCFFPCSSGFLYLLILLEFAANFVLKDSGSYYCCEPVGRAVKYVCICHVFPPAST